MTSVNAELFHREQDQQPESVSDEPCAKCGAATPTQCECPREMNAHVHPIFAAILNRFALSQPTHTTEKP